MYNTYNINVNRKDINMKFSFVPSIISAAIILAGTGCYNIFDPGSTELKTHMKWENDLPDIDPIEGERRIVYLSYKDASGGDLPNLRSDISKSLGQCGYIVTKNPKEAWYMLEIRVRYFGEQRDEKGNSAIVGGVAGGVGGAVAGSAVTGHGTLTGIGGAAAGALAGSVIDKHNPIRTYDFVLEVSVGELIPEGFSESVVGKGKTTSTASYDKNVEGGSKATSTTSYEQIATDLVRKKNFYKHTNKLTISASKRNLTSDEAYDAVVNRLVKAFGGVMPDVDADVEAVTPAQMLKSLSEKK